MDFQRLVKITTINLRHNSLIHFAAALVLALLTSMVFGVTALDWRNAAQPLEMLLSLAGAVLLTPIFLPEQNENIRDVIRSRRKGYRAVCALRVLYSLLFLALIVGGFTLVMRLCESDVSILHFTAGFASAFFLGAIGFMVAGLSGSATTGYMAAMIYYLANFGLNKKLGMFFLFRMYMDNNSDINYRLIAASVLLILFTFAAMRIREIRR